MAFNLDYNQINQIEDLKPGAYECVVSDYEFKTTMSGSQCIQVTYTIRNDFTQAGQNQKIWHSIWKVKDPSATNNLDGYLASPILELARAAKLPNGASFNNVSALLDAIVHSRKLPVKVTIKKEQYINNKGETKTSTQVSKVEESQFSQVNHKYNEKAPSSFEPVSNDSIPF